MDFYVDMITFLVIFLLPSEPTKTIMMRMNEYDLASAQAYPPVHHRGQAKKPRGALAPQNPRVSQKCKKCGHMMLLKKVKVLDREVKIY